MFGGEGPEREALMALAADLGVADSVEFVGWLGDQQIATLLSTADVCLSPEPSTPLNDRSTMVKVGEYMAMSRPIVAFELPQTRRNAGGAATYARSGDVTDYASKIAELLDSPARREQMGALGRDRVQRSLTWEHSTATLLAAYRQALSLQARTSVGVPAPPLAAPGT